MRSVIASLAILALTATVASAGIFGGFNRPDPDMAIYKADGVPLDLAFVYYGVSSGVAFEDFLNATKEELTLTGQVAYETPGGQWLEFAETGLGGTSPTFTSLFRVGQRVYQVGWSGMYLGGEVLSGEVRNQYAGWFAGKFTLSDAHDARVVCNLDQDGKVGIELGLFVVETLWPE